MTGDPDGPWAIDAVARPRVIATDFDGTLLRSDGTLSDRTRAAIDAWDASGGIFVVVTARPPRWMNAYRGQIGGHPLVICGNGAFVYDLDDGRVVEEHLLAEPAVTELVKELRAAAPGIAFAAERSWGITYEPGFPERGGAHPLPPEGASAEIGSEPVGKLLARHHRRSSRELLELVTAIVGERGTIAFSGAVGLAEVTAPGVTKGAALQRWSRAQGISSAEVWAFGDMFNDLPMMTWAGLGVAVANGHPDVRAAADVTCLANDDDGIALVIEELLAGG